MLQMPPDIPADAKNDRADNDDVEALHDRAQARIAVPLFAQFVTDIGERKTPRPRADEGIDLEFDLRHAGDAGRQRDERSHDWQEPADQNGDAAVAREEIVRPVELAPAYQHIAAPTLDKRPAAVVADGIGDGRPEVQPSAPAVATRTRSNRPVKTR